MRSERPTTGTESYELVEQADALQRLVNCLAVNDLDVEFFKISIPIYKTVECGKPLLSITTIIDDFFMTLASENASEIIFLSFGAEEYAFPYRLSKAIIKGSPLDGMVELLLVHKPLLWEFFARKCVVNCKMNRKNGRIEKKVYAKIPVQQLLCEKYATVTIVIGSYSQDCLHIMIFSFVQLLKEISSFAVWNDWRKLPPRQMVFKFESSSGEEHLHLPTATMAVSTVNYMQYDSSPDVWNFDDQEKELSDVQLMANHFCRVDEVHF
ncbi:hypothetical protein T05_7677 [Trichinella murrelli]|uniref:Uncharacterized protein n=1 Tax=Trichinella murrelli TaxID=144512 RepID=A0A0V0TZ73_9BILA|nr:hypothetical protein T05_7677 [Trichinella murrelli]